LTTVAQDEKQARSGRLRGLPLPRAEKRIRRQRLAGFLRDLPVTLDAETADQAWTATARLAERYRLTMYDAAYLELAQRRKLPLATLDQDLIRAGNPLGMTLLGT
jgi:predicted nucleic acid-binding protein